MQLSLWELWHILVVRSQGGVAAKGEKTGWLKGENMKDRAFLQKIGERNIHILGRFSLFFEPICHITDPHFTEVVYKWKIMIKEIEPLIKMWNDSPYFSILFIQIVKTATLTLKDNPNCKESKYPFTITYHYWNWVCPCVSSVFGRNVILNE